MKLKRIRSATPFCDYCGTRTKRHYVNHKVPEYFCRKSKLICPNCGSEYEDKDE
jgi:rRNA maturation endonuclease Nob1